MTSSARYIPFGTYGGEELGEGPAHKYQRTGHSVMFLMLQLVVAIWKIILLLYAFLLVWNTLLEGQEITMPIRNNAFLENVSK